MEDIVENLENVDEEEISEENDEIQQNEDSEKDADLESKYGNISIKKEKLY